MPDTMHSTTALEDATWFRTVAERAGNPIVVTDPARRIVWVNAAFTRRTGYALDEVRGRHPGRLFQFERTDQATVRRISEALAAGRPVREAIENRSRSGERYWIDLDIQPLHDASGRLSGFVGVQTDITELIDARRRLSDVIAGARIGSWEWDVVTGENRINDTWAGMIGYAAAELEPVTIDVWRRLIHPHDFPRVVSALEKVLHGTAGQFEYEFRFRHRDSHWVHVLSTGRVLERDAEGRPLRMAGVHVDVTARRELEQALAAESELQQALTETSVSGIVAFDAEGRIVFVNPEASRVLGMAQHDLLRRTCDDPAWEITTLDGEPMAEDEMPFRRVVASGAPVRNTRHAIRLPDGRRRMLSVNAAPLPRRPMGAAVVCAVTDITEQFEAERALQVAIEEASAATDRYRHMARLNRSWIWEVDADLRFTHLSKSYGQITGLDSSRILGRSFAEVRESWNQENHRADFTALDRIIEARAPFSGFVYGFRRRSGEVRWVRIDGEPISDAEGRFSGYRGAGSDVTQLYEMRMRAEEASKAKSDFLAMMSHEIRTPLNGILGMAELVYEAAESPEMREKIGVIRDSGEALLCVLNDVLDLSRIDVGRLEFDTAPFAPAAVVRRTCALHQPRAQEKRLYCRLEASPEPGPARLGDANRVGQIVSNLVSNAVKFTDAGGVVLTIDNPEDGPLRLTVSDTGIGMNAEHSARVFQPFVQADSSIARRFGGTGLGLSIVRRLVDMMQGRIAIDSREGEGTRFCVELPLPVAEMPVDARLPSGAGSSGRGRLAGMRVLVAEDNQTNLTILRKMLEALGVEAVYAQDGRTACARWSPGRFDALLFDINMPAMDGRTALATLQERARSAGVILPPAAAITAAAMAHEVEAHAACGFAQTLTKPFRQEALAELLGRLRHAG
jgi:PAS domain S-box-containing protein